MTAARVPTPVGALQRVWAVVRAAGGAVTPAQVAVQAGLDPALTAALLDWLVRRGYLQRWEGGQVCPAPAGTACRSCPLRAWCPAPGGEEEA